MASHPKFWRAPLWVFVRSPIACCTRYVAHLSTWMWESRSESFVCGYLHTDKGISNRRSLLICNNCDGLVSNQELSWLRYYRIGHWKGPFSRKHTRSQAYDSSLPSSSGSQGVFRHNAAAQWNWQTHLFLFQATVTRCLFRWGGMLGAGLFCPGECPGSISRVKSLGLDSLGSFWIAAQCHWFSILL